MPKQKLFLGELHGHTYFSDGSSSPEEVIEEAIKKGLNFLSITDHDTTAGLARALAYTKKRNREGEKFLFIPGMEATTSTGDVIALVPDQKFIDAFLQFQYQKHQTDALTFIRDVVSRFNALCILAHPDLPFDFAIKTAEIQLILSQLTIQEKKHIAVEVCNWASLAYPGRQSSQAALREQNMHWGLAEVAGSDYHTPRNIGKAQTAISRPELTGAEFIAAFISRKIQPQIPQIFWSHIPDLLFSAAEVELRNTLFKSHS